MYKKFKVLFLAVLLFFISVLVSCAENPEAISGDTTASADSTQPPAEEESYFFPLIDLAGGDFTLFNTTTTWNFYTYLDHEKMTGEVLDDTIYNRNRLIEEKFNLKLKVIEEKIDNIYNKISVSVQSGEQLYDAVFCPGWINDSSNIGSLAIKQMFYDLSELPEISLESEWWSQALRIEGSIGKNGELYFAASDINLSTLQSTWCLFFNETLFENMNFERPYNLVTDGKWTFDKFAELVKAGAQLNGEENFAWTADGGSIYGYTSYTGGTLALLLGSGERFTGKDSDGNPILALETQRFYDVCTKTASLLGMAGYYLNANDSSQNGFHFEDIFMKGRALFTGAELKAATRFRTMEDAYGIVPMPKYNEVQPDYYSVKTRQAYLSVIPSTNSEPNRTGAILDALAYVSYKDVTPVLYDVTISQKGLRNEESVEMLKIIRNTQYYDAGIIYGWTSALNNAIITAVDAGKSDIASIIEKNKNKVIADIQKTMDIFYG